MSLAPTSKDGFSVLIMLVSYLLYAIGDAVAKHVLLSYEVLDVMFMNGLFVMLFMMVYGLSRGGAAYFKTTKLKYYLFKGVVGFFLGVLVLYGLGTVTLSEFYLMVFTAPLWVVLLSMIWLREKFDVFRTLIVLSGFGVIIYVFAPGADMVFTLGHLATLVCALLVAINMIFIRKYLRGEPDALIGGANSTLIALVLLPILGWHMPPEIWGDVHYFAICGFCILMGTICLAKAFHIASHTAVLAPFHYSQMIYGVLIGYFIFDEEPNSRTVIGLAALAALGVLMVAYDYHKNKRTRRLYDAPIAKP